MKDDILVEQTLAGDKQAFNSLITDYYADIYGMILSWVKNPEDAKDLAQDVFISAYFDLPSLKDHKLFYSWIRQIARHKCQNLKREQIDLAPLHDDLISKEPSTDEVLILRETLAKVMEAIDNLPESEKRLLKEHYLDDVSYDELEAKHGVSTKALVVRLVRIRRKIRDQLEKTLSAFVAFFHDHTESILTGGMETMKLSVKTKLIAGGIAVMLLLGGAGILVRQYYMQYTSKQKSQENYLQLPAKSVSDDRKRINNILPNKKVIKTHIEKPNSETIEVKSFSIPKKVPTAQSNDDEIKNFHDWILNWGKRDTLDQKEKLNNTQKFGFDTEQDKKQVESVIFNQWKRGYETYDIEKYMSSIWEDSFFYVSDRGTPDDLTDDIIFRGGQKECESAKRIFNNYRRIELNLYPRSDVEFLSDKNAMVKYDYKITFSDPNYVCNGNMIIILERRESSIGRSDWRILEWYDYAVLK